MAIRNWTDGEILTGADLDYLTGSSVMRFADAANRDATLIGDLAPKEGMVAFLADVNHFTQYMTYNGVNKWGPMPGTILFDGYASANQTLANATSTVVLGLTSSEYLFNNLDAAYNVSNGKFTAIYPGMYLFNAAVAFVHNATGYRQLWLRTQGGAIVNGSRRSVTPTATASYTSVVLTTAHWMNPTDTVELMSSQSSGGSLDIFSSAADYQARLSIVYQGI